MVDLDTILHLTAHYLTKSSLSKTEAALTFIALESQQQMVEMCRFLKNNEAATPDEIVGELEKILTRTTQDPLEI